MHPQRPPLAIRQNLEVSASLRRLYDSKSVFLPGHLKIIGIVAGDLQEYSGVGAAFVGLSRGMKETRSKAQASCRMLAVAHGMAHGLQRIFMRAVHLDICQKS